MSSYSIHLAEIAAARERIEGHIRRTPLERSLYCSKQFGASIYFKLENWQKTGSFKIRGATNKLLMLTDREKTRGIVTASAGNHALGVASVASLLGIKGKIVVAETASPAKIAAIGQYDLELVKHGLDYDAAEAFAWQVQEREDLTFVHAFNDPQVIAGQGTVGLEILEEEPDVDTLVVPIGGGGLISGIAIAAKAINPAIRIIGVQSEASPAMYRAIQEGKVVETPIEETVADGLAGRLVAEETLALTMRYVDDVVLVSEKAIKEAMKLILEHEHMLVEAAAAAAPATLLDEKITISKKMAFVLTGRNISTKLLKSII